jgi:Fe2+ or Zn2+ uptake regulation protein
MNIIERLQKFGIKPSLQRMAVMEYLMKHPVHPTVDMIFNDLSPNIPTLSKTTVYNTLKLFSERGAILTLNIDEKNVRYDADISEHAHFRCENCGNIHDLHLEGVDSLNVKNINRLTIKECHIYYKGYCENCQAQMHS